MKALIAIVLAAALSSLAPNFAAAADLGGYYERDTYVDRPARVVERELIVIEHYHYPPRYVDDDPLVLYSPRRAYYPYSAGLYHAERFQYRHRYHHRHRHHDHRRW